MKYEKYEPLLFSDEAHEFKFTSVGPNGEIIIVVQYIKTDNPIIYANQGLGMKIKRRGVFLLDGSANQQSNQSLLPRLRQI